MSRWTSYQLAIVVLFLVMLAGLWWVISREPAAPGAKPVPPQAPHHFQVFLHREPCVGGACPTYAVLAKSSSNAIQYVGGRNVAVRGKETAPLTDEQLAALYGAVKRANFFSIDDVYHNGRGGTGCDALVRGKPRIVIGVTRKSRTKIIHYDYGCRGAPATLERLAADIDDILKTSRWTDASR